MTYKIIATGSKGNCLYIANGDFKAIVDCGVPFKAIEGLEFDYVLLTHSHSDHFNKSTCRRIAWNRPNVRFLCGGAMVKHLQDAGVPDKNIFAFTGKCKVKGAIVEIFPLHHDVYNFGYKLYIDNLALMYATDTAHLDDVQARDFDYYFIEGNYDEDTIWDRIREKRLAGEYVYETRVFDTHLSIQQAMAWLGDNAGPNSQYILMHQHQDDEKQEVEGE